MSWTGPEEMHHAKALLARRIAAGEIYGRWLNSRVEALIEEIELLRKDNKELESDLEQLHRITQE